MNLPKKLIIAALGSIALAAFLGMLLAFGLAFYPPGKADQAPTFSNFTPELPYEIKITGHQVKVTGTQWTGHSMWVEADSHGRPTKIPDGKWEPKLRAEYDAGIYTNLWMTDEEIAEAEAARKSKESHK